MAEVTTTKTIAEWFDVPEGATPALIEHLNTTLMTFAIPKFKYKK